jgi:transcription termination factor NusB|tara:strand:- start:3549 stop:3956 length:408 start_codon:yes stop_codon:yes gene_type:complete
MHNINRNSRLFFFQYIFQRDYSNDTNLEEFMKSNLKKSVFNKRKMRDLFNSYSTNLDLIKSLCEESESEKYNKVSVFLLHSFFSEYLLLPKNQNILMNEYIEISKEFLTKQEVGYFNHLLDKILKKYLENKFKIE